MSLGDCLNSSLFLVPTSFPTCINALVSYPLLINLSMKSCYGYIILSSSEQIRLALINWPLRIPLKVWWAWKLSCLSKLFLSVSFENSVVCNTFPSFLTLTSRVFSDGKFQQIVDIIQVYCKLLKLQLRATPQYKHVIDVTKPCPNI